MSTANNKFRGKNPTYSATGSIPGWQKIHINMYTHNHRRLRKPERKGNQEWGKGQLEKLKEQNKKTSKEKATGHYSISSQDKRLEVGRNWSGIMVSSGDTSIVLFKPEKVWELRETIQKSLLWIMLIFSLGKKKNKIPPLKRLMPSMEEIL